MEQFYDYISEVAGHFAFHRSEHELSPGAILVPDSQRYTDPHDEVFEIVRKERFPNLPSRLTSVYLSPNVKESYAWQYASDYIYKVRILSGNTFRADASWYEAAMDSIEKDMPELAVKYWSSMRSPTPRWELLADGKVMVIAEIGGLERQAADGARGILTMKNTRYPTRYPKELRGDKAGKKAYRQDYFKKVSDMNFPLSQDQADYILKHVNANALRSLDPISRSILQSRKILKRDS